MRALMHASHQHELVQLRRQRLGPGFQQQNGTAAGTRRPFEALQIGRDQPLRPGQYTCHARGWPCVTCIDMVTVQTAWTLEY